jgi:hypothetical protein
MERQVDENGLEYKLILVDPDCPQAVEHAKTEWVNYRDRQLKKQEEKH